jgi:hypothetical protein
VTVELGALVGGWSDEKMVETFVWKMVMEGRGVISVAFLVTVLL